MELKFKSKNLNTIKFMVQSILIVIPIYMSLTRIQDYAHHPVDVIARLVLGAMVALFVKKVFIRSSSLKIKYQNSQPNHKTFT